MKRRFAPLAAAALLIALAGCTATDGTNDPTPEPTTTAVGLPDGVTGATDVPTDVPNDVELRKNVTVDTCAATDGGWEAAGTANNPGDAEVTYTVTVFFTASTATVLATGETTVTVPAGESADWSISSEFTAPEGTQCVLRGVA